MAKRSEDPPPDPPENGVQIPLLEDITSVQIALTRVLTSLAMGKITPAEANAFIYGLRLARHNVARGGLIDGEQSEAYIQYDNGDVVGPEQFREEALKPEHPLLDTGMMALRHLSRRLDYEAVIDSYLTQGKEPPEDLIRPPVLRPSDPEEHKKWVAFGWKAAQTRAIAIEDARKGIRRVPIPPKPGQQPPSQPNSAQKGTPSTGFPAKPTLVDKDSDPNALARAAISRTGHG